MRTVFVKLCLCFWLAMTLSGAVFFFLAFNLRPAPMHEKRLEHLDTQRRNVVKESLLFFGLSAAELWEREHSLERARPMDGPGGKWEAAYLFAADGTPLSPRVPLRLRQALREGVPPPDLLAVKVASRSGGSYIAALLDRPPAPPEFAKGFPFPPLFWARFGCTFVVVALVCYALAWHLTTPVRQLRAAAQSMARGDLAARVRAVGKEGGDELSDLGRDFNRMAEQLEKLLNSHRQLVRDVSHELRSPLARLTVALELCRKAAPTSAADALDRIELEAERLNQLIGELLALSRLEGGEIALNLRDVDLCALLDLVVRDAAFEAQGGEKVVSFHCSTPVVVKGDRELLHRALENVVRNAVRYTEAGTEVEVTLNKEGGEGAVRVLDHGPGVPEGALGDIFKPFFRVAASRDRRSGGTGIGLAITERTVTLHGGSVAARNVAGGGLEVEILLPGAAPAV